jgi:hypothetical protein
MLRAIQFSIKPKNPSRSHSSLPNQWSLKPSSSVFANENKSLIFNPVRFISRGNIKQRAAMEDVKVKSKDQCFWLSALNSFSSSKQKRLW